MSFHRSDCLDVGTDIGGYRILSVVKAGGFGVIYRTVATGRRAALVRRQLGPDRHLVMLDDLPVVAVKEFFPFQLAQRIDGQITVTNSEYRSVYDKALEKFISESQRLITDFDHVNVVRGIELFSSGGTYYFAMEFLVGQNLTDWLSEYTRERGQAPDERAIRGLFEQLLDAVALVHELDQMHRDIKPDNIMIRRDGSPVLIDFGLVGEGLDKARKGTLTALTPGYAPPEQTGAQFMPLGGRVVDLRRQGRYTDIYALGAVLFRAVVGRPPPYAEDRIDRVTGGGADDVDVMLASVAGRYAPQLLRGIAQALALDPAMRPPSVPDLRVALGWMEPFSRPGTLIRQIVEQSTERERAEPSLGQQLGLDALETAPLPSRDPPSGPPSLPGSDAETKPLAGSAAILSAPRAAAAPALETVAIAPQAPSPGATALSPPARPPDAAPRPQVRTASGKGLIYGGAAGAAALALIGIALFGPLFSGGDDPARARDGVRSAMREQGLNWTAVELDGTDIAVSGAAPSAEDRARALDIARRAAGSRRVVDRVQVAPPDVPDAQLAATIRDALRVDGGANVTVTVGRGGVVIGGQVADDATARRLIERARTLAGGRPVIDTIETESGLRAMIVAALTREGVDGATANVDRSEAAIGGRVADEAGRERALRAVRPSIGNRQLRASIETNAERRDQILAALRQSGITRVTVDVTPTNVALGGRTADDAEKARALDRVRALSSGRNVSDGVVSDGATAAAITAALRAAGFPSIEVEVRPDGVRLRGRAGNQAEQNRIVEAARRAAGGLPVVDDIDMDSAALASIAAAIRSAGGDTVTPQAAPSGAIRLTGRVATPAQRTRVVEAARRASGNRGVEDAISIDSEVLAQTLQALDGAGLRGVTVDVSTAVVLGGLVPDEAARERALDIARRAAGGRPVTDALETFDGLNRAVTAAVRGAGGPEVEVTVGADGVTLEGRAPDAATRTRVVDAVRAISARGLTVRIQVDSDVVDAVMAAVRQAPGSRGVTASIEGNRIVLAGRVADEAAKAEALAQARTVATGRGLTDRISVDSLVRGRVAEALRSLPAGGIDVRIDDDGRVVLQGLAADDAARNALVEAARRAADGREVVAQLDSRDAILASGTEAARRSGQPNIRVEFSPSGALMISGTVPDDAARNRVIDAFAALRNRVPLEDRIEVEGSTLASVRAAIGAVTRAPIEVTLRPDGVTVAGRVDTEVERRAVIAAVRRALPQRAVTDRLTTAGNVRNAINTAVQPFGPTLHVVSSGGVLTVRGRVVDEAVRARAIAAARGAAGGETVADEIVTGTAAREAVARAVAAVSRAQITITVEGDDIVLDGRIPDSAERDRIMRAAQEASLGWPVAERMRQSGVLRDEILRAATIPGTTPTAITVNPDNVRLAGRSLFSASHRRALAAAEAAARPLPVVDALYVMPTPPQLQPGGLREAADADDTADTVARAIRTAGGIDPIVYVDGPSVFISAGVPTEASMRNVVAAAEDASGDRVVVPIMRLGGGTLANPPPLRGRRTPSACEAAALPPDHPERPLGFAGVPYHLIDTTRAMRVCAAEAEAPNAPARILLAAGLASLRAARPDEAFGFLIRAAADNDPVAMGWLGYMFENGLRRGPNAAVLAAQWYEQGAARNNVFSAIQLARLLREGRPGLAHDPRRAIMLLEQAAGQGSSTAMYELGVMHRGTVGVPADAEASRRWFERAAQMGNPFAHGALAAVYRNTTAGTADSFRAEIHVSDAVANLVRRYALGDFEVRSAVETGLASVPGEIRTELQRLLSERRAYDGPLDGAVNDRVRNGLVSFAGSLR